MIRILDLLFILITIGSSISIILGYDRRWIIAFLGFQYLGVFWFVLSTWPFNLAIIKLISGLIVCIILAFASEDQNLYTSKEHSWPQGRAFRIFAASLIVISTLSVSSITSTWLGISNQSGMWIGLFLLSMGILQLGITTQHEKVIIALLTFISGFEIIYSFVESSSLVAALLVIINIGLAFVGVYLHLMELRDKFK